MSFRLFSNLIALPHSVFALPFALAALILAARGEAGDLPLPITAALIIYVIGAVVAARTAAMAFNRLVDVGIDRLNPRTQARPLAAGELSIRSVVILVVASSGLFLVFSALLGMHCLVLAPFVLAVLLGYSFCKRFTPYAHIVLGLSLALAPGGAWWVLRPEIRVTPLLLMLGVLLWVAGFDVLYSCQDEEFDRKNELFSIPARFGIPRSLVIAKGLHIASIIAFFLVGVSASLSWMYFLGCGILGAIQLGQHRLVSANDLSRINQAFFTFNGLVSIGYFLLVFLTT